jgi:peptide deformylase
MDLKQLVSDDGKLTIRYWGDPVLSTVCDPVTADEFGPELERFGKLMLETIRRMGIGLAAPQIGLTKRVFVMVRQDESLPPIIAVNPEVLPTGPDVPHAEGCLSLPGLTEQVMRPPRAEMRYQEPLTGEWRSVILEGYDAFCAQHELDHLNGIVFIQRLSRQMKKAALRKWEKRKKENHEKSCDINNENRSHL